MARCGCASDRCSCHFIAGENIILSGTGTRSNPYVIQAVADPNAGGGGGGTTGPTRLTGEIVAFGGANAPAGWLICDGSLVDRGAFPALFAVIGTAYGAGDGMTTFRIPNLNGKFPIGADSSKPRGTSGGRTTFTITSANLPTHSHSLAAHTHGMGHTHNIAHTHNMDHDHPNATSVSNGDHTHTLSLTSSGTGQYPDRGGLAGNVTTSGNQGVSTSGAHQHTVSTPYHYGSTGGASSTTSGNSSSATTAGPSTTNTGDSGSASPTAIDITPSYTSVVYIIKT